MAKWAWVVDAKCLDAPDEVKAQFFDYEKRGPAVVDERVQHLCNTCPVHAKCLEHALGLVWPYKPERYGYWAGTTAPERRALRAQMGIIDDEE